MMAEFNYVNSEDELPEHIQAELESMNQYSGWITKGRKRWQGVVPELVGVSVTQQTLEGTISALVHAESQATGEPMAMLDMNISLGLDEVGEELAFRAAEYLRRYPGAPHQLLAPAIVLLHSTAGLSYADIETMTGFPQGESRRIWWRVFRRTLLRRGRR